MKLLDKYIFNFLSTFFESPEEKQFAYFNEEQIDAKYNTKTSEWEHLTQEYKSLLPYSNIPDYKMEVGESGSFFINKLFDMYVDDQTFVISSFEEHDTTQNCLKNVKNKLILGIQNQIKKIDIDYILRQYKNSKCNKVFLYMVGTSLTSGEIISEEFFYQLKQSLNKNNIEHFFVLDDVHGMFITPRDYSLFDVILYTAHSWVKGFEMGLIFHNTDNTFGVYDYQYAKNYLNKLKIFTDKFDKVRQFKTIMIQFFAEELSHTEDIGIYDNTTQHILTLKTHGLSFDQNDWDCLHKYLISFSEYNLIDNFIRIRFQELISFDPEYAIEGLHTVKKIIKKAIFIKNSSGVIPNFDGSKHIKTDYI